jgi:hypothetical protein
VYAKVFGASATVQLLHRSLITIFLPSLVLSPESRTNQPMPLLSDYHFTAFQWAVALFAAFGLGMSKTGFLGIALLDVALMAEIWPPRESTGVILPMLVFADFFAIFFFRVTLCGAKYGESFRRLWSGSVWAFFVSGLFPLTRLLRSSAGSCLF